MSIPASSGLGRYDLSGKVAVVTGGSGGIGAATARLLAAEGARVLVGFNAGAARADEVVASLAGTGHATLRVPMGDSAAIDAAADEVRRSVGRVDVLVNAAGVTKLIPHGDLDALDDATFDAIYITNVRGPFAAVRSFAPLLRASGDAVVVNVSSIAASTGSGSSIAYCASKAALDTMGMSLARVLGPEVRVIGVAPAAVDTAFVPGRGHDALERQAASTPLRVVAQPEDVALSILAAVTHLRLSTGTVVVTDGGRHL